MLQLPFAHHKAQQEKELIDRNIHQKNVAGTWDEKVTRSGIILTKQT